MGKEARVHLSVEHLRWLSARPHHAWARSDRAHDKRTGSQSVRTARQAVMPYGYLPIWQTAVERAVRPVGSAARSRSAPAPCPHGPPTPNDHSWRLGGPSCGRCRWIERIGRECARGQCNGTDERVPATAAAHHAQRELCLHAAGQTQARVAPRAQHHIRVMLSHAHIRKHMVEQFDAPHVEHHDERMRAAMQHAKRLRHIGRFEDITALTLQQCSQLGAVAAVDLHEQDMPVPQAGDRLAPAPAPHKGNDRGEERHAKQEETAGQKEIVSHDKAHDMQHRAPPRAFDVRRGRHNCVGVQLSFARIERNRTEHTHAGASLARMSVR